MPSKIEPRQGCNCEPASHRTFNGEIALHFPGLEGLNKPIVWVFPQISVCMNCGAAHFTVPERELGALRTGAPVEGAVVSLGNEDREKPS